MCETKFHTHNILLTHVYSHTAYTLSAKNLLHGAEDEN
jgi:hypothetical protein